MWHGCCVVILGGGPAVAVDAPGTGALAGGQALDVWWWVWEGGPGSSR